MRSAWRTGSGEWPACRGWRACGVAQGVAGIQCGRCRSPKMRRVAGQSVRCGRRGARGHGHGASATVACTCAAASVGGGRFRRGRAGTASGPACGLRGRRRARGVVRGQCGRRAVEACGACLQPIGPDGCARAAPAATWRVWWRQRCVCGRVGPGARDRAQRAQGWTRGPWGPASRARAREGEA